jgi:hypothetical protein
MLFDPSVNLADFGMPLILFEPRASFIGWLGLMIVVSPALQFLLTILGAHVALLRQVRSGARGPGDGGLGRNAENERMLPTTQRAGRRRNAVTIRIDVVA